jgi:hypothetical protein
MEHLFELAERYPQLAVLVVTLIVWPTITGLMSLGYARLEARFPALVELLRASGLDLPRATQALRAAWPKRLPPPPPGPLLLLCIVFLVGCAGQFDPAEAAKAIDGANTVITIGEPCVTAALNADLDACETEACREKQLEINGGVVDGVAVWRKFACFVKPELKGCP